MKHNMKGNREKVYAVLKKMKSENEFINRLVLVANNQKEMSRKKIKKNKKQVL